MLALTGRLSLQGHSKRSPHLVYEPDQRVWFPWHYHLSIWIKVQKRECDSDCGKSLQKHPFVSIFNEWTYHHNWESHCWDPMKAFENYFIDISNNPLKTFPGELKSIHNCKPSPFLRRVPITGRSCFMWRKDAYDMELHWPASPETPSPPRLHVSWVGISHAAFDLAQHSEGASLSTLHSPHPHWASLWSKDCAMLDYNQLPLYLEPGFHGQQMKPDASGTFGCKHPTWRPASCTALPGPFLPCGCPGRHFWVGSALEVPAH